jgi:hypothetical protein
MHSAAKVPTWYWVVSVLALLWMLVGIAAFAMDLMTDEAAMVTFTDAQRQLYESRPQWLLVVYAVATIGGLIGAIGLLTRKAWAVPTLLASLVAVAFQFGYTLFGLHAIEILGAAEAVPFPLVIFLIGAAVFWFATKAKANGWLQ